MALARPVFVALILCVIIATPAPAADSEAGVRPAVASEAAVVVLNFLELPLEELPPRLRVIREILDTRSVALAELQARYEAATSDEQALLVQREMHELKQGTELTLLQAQLEFAREEGAVEKVAELESILDRATSRAGVLGPVERPRSVDESQEQK
ncbi:hypothetical protein DRQ53_04785 [bacterium]|nr:MAG: hypothetical protein DRQ32_02425 [bacterium]RKZ16989.1 MAG: hypothetical protein DRQ53_04785 [bacterium]